MRKLLSSFLAGFIFAIGLGISGMTDTKKVIGFLDVFGNFDPSLIFVMIGAIAIHFIAFKFIMKQPSPILDTKWYVPNQKKLTPSLIIGSILFGIGWALAGYCPGPALTSLASLNAKPFIFVVSMIGGMAFFQACFYRKSVG